MRLGVSVLESEVSELALKGGDVVVKIDKGLNRIAGSFHGNDGKR